MRSIQKLAFSLIGLMGLVVSPSAWARPALSDIVAEETRRAESDLAAGGVRTLSANWYACLDQARASQNANAAERCIIYGYRALRLTDAGATAAPWTRHLTPDMVDQGQNEMLDIMGIPGPARQAWLERYRRSALESDPGDQGAADAGGRTSLLPVISDIGGPPLRPSAAGDESPRDPAINLARAADGKYPREALRDPEIADAMRRLVGPGLFPRLKDYNYGAPMAFTGRYTVGLACPPGACGVSEARFVFSADDVWLGIVEGRRLRIYGNPPRAVRALLMRDRNQIAWRGPVENMSRPAPPAIIPVTADQPRLTISPRLPPLSAEPPARQPPRDEVTEIPLRRAHDSLLVPVLVNNVLTVPFMVDSGASDVSISLGVMEKLIESGTLTRADFRGKATYHLADGSQVASDTFRLRSLRVGDREVHDVLASVTNDANGLLLGQSFLTRFRSWSIDNQRQVLLLK